MTICKWGEHYYGDNYRVPGRSAGPNRLPRAIKRFLFEILFGSYIHINTLSLTMSSRNKVTKATSVGEVLIGVIIQAIKEWLNNPARRLLFPLCRSSASGI